jgi:quercetin dioxygenase-like cupin family protein|tara:strand:+ start:123 stop:464 length:342 start_codon:yes stop_codon:yes gene_type:complete
MIAFDLKAEQEFSLEKQVEKILGTESGGDVTVACWEPGQTSPNHCHPQATEIYYCLEGRGHMNVNGERIKIQPGKFILHPPGEIHEYVNGDQRSLLFRVRYGDSMESRHIEKN